MFLYKRHRRLAALILTFSCLSATADDCLSVTEQSISPRETRIAAGSVEWHVVLENRCNKAFDADLTLRLQDAEGETVHKARDLIVVPRKGQAESSKRVYILERLAELIVGLTVEVEERERPY